MLKVRSNWAYFSPLKSDLVVNHQQQKEGQNHHRQPKAHVPLTITQAKEYFSILDNSSEKKTGQEFCHGNQTRHSEILNTVSTVHLFWKFKFLAKAKSSLILALAVQLKLLVAFFREDLTHVNFVMFVISIYWVLTTWPDVLDESCGILANVGFWRYLAVASSP